MAGNNLKKEVERLKKEFYEGMRELRLNQQKTDEQHRKTEEEIEKTSRMVAKLTDGWGQFVEGLVEPNLYPLFAGFGVKITGTFPRPTRHLNGQTMEVDILAVGKTQRQENVIIYVEAKTNPSQKDVKELVRHIESFPRFFHEYKGWPVMGALAGIKVSSSVSAYAEKCGLYVLSPSGNTMKVLNKKSFKPKVWR